METPRDPGLDVVEHVYSQMLIDKEWSVFEPRGFTWWGHHLAQRVWADAPRESFGMNVVRVHAETHLVRGVNRRPREVGILDEINTMASLSALVFDPGDQTVTMRSSVIVHEQNVERLKRVFTHVVAIQVAEAEKRAAHLAHDLDGEVDSSQHPVSGLRPSPDGMLAVIEDVYLREGSAPPPVTKQHFQAALDVLPGAALLANVSDTGLTAEFPFYGNVPAPGTALLMINIERHPFLGYGVLAQLALPSGAIDLDAAPVHLNLTEATEWTSFHTLGSWCTSPLGLTFLTFIPAAAWAVAPPAFLYETMAVRCQWVRDARDRL